MHDSAENATAWKNNKSVLINDSTHVSHVTNGYSFIVELKLDNPIRLSQTSQKSYVHTMPET